MRIRAAGATDTGKVRANNEDCFLIEDDLGLFVVCDGMGGHEAGEVASRVAADTVLEVVRDNRDLLTDFEDTPDNRNALVALAGIAINAASAAVYERARSEGKVGMGTTVSLVIIADTVAAIGHVGDSRVYLLRKSKLHQLSEDHTFLTEFVRHGLSVEEAQKNRMSHRLTRAVGLQERVQVDTLLVDLLTGDRMLLCSDGLVSELEAPAEITSMMLGGSVSSRPEALLEYGLEHDGSDNITALFIAALPDVEPSLRERTRDQHTILKLEAMRHIWLFEHLSLREKSRILERVRERTCPEGTVIIEQGGTGDSLFIVVEGELLVLQHGQIINRLEAGAHFGEMALVSQRPRNATIQALKETRVLELSREDFADIINENTELGVKMLWTLSEVLIERLSRL